MGKKRIRILIIDDEEESRRKLFNAVNDVFKCRSNAGAVDATIETPNVEKRRQAIDFLLELVSSAVETRDFSKLPNLIVLDWKLAGEAHPGHPNIHSGLDLFIELAHLLSPHPTAVVNVILVTGYMEGPEDVVKSNLGASYQDQLDLAINANLFDFWPKPLDFEAIKSSLQSMFALPSRWLDIQEIAGRCDHMQEAYEERKPDNRCGNQGPALCEFVGRSESFQRVVTQVERLSKANRRLCVLIRGETGTGKELAARMLHDWEHLRSNSRDEWSFKETWEKFHAVNCAEFTDELLQSELFGHEVGAFTGAKKPREGIFEQADGGTVFLDEIGEAGPRFKAMLLRFLETRRVTRLGQVGIGKEVNIRVVLATDRDLKQEVNAGRISEAFYQRVSALQVVLDPLRERPEDIPILASAFWQKAFSSSFPETEQTSIASMLVNDDGRHGLFNAAFSPGALLELLHGTNWPGNVRQLRNIIEAAVLIAGPDGAKRLTRPHIREALRLEHTLDLPRTRVSRKRYELWLEELRIIEQMWNDLEPDYDPDSDRPPGKVGTIQKLADTVIGFGQKMERGLESRMEALEGNRDEFPYLYSYVTKKVKVSGPLITRDKVATPPRVPK